MTNNFILFDNGTSTIKSINEHSFDAETDVRSITNEIGRPLQFSNMKEEEYYIGSILEEKRDILAIKSPIERGIIKNFHDVEKIWNFIYEREFNYKSKETATFLTECLQCPKKVREKSMEILFETFEIPSFFSEKTTTLTSYSHGVSSAFIIEMGHGLTQIDTMNEGFHMKESSTKYERYEKTNDLINEFIYD